MRGGKNAGTFDFFESIFEPSMCGQLVQTSLSVCKWRPGDVHASASVKLYSRIRSTVFPLSFCSARACQIIGLPLCPPIHNKSLWQRLYSSAAEKWYSVLLSMCMRSCRHARQSPHADDTICVAGRRLRMIQDRLPLHDNGALPSTPD